MEKTTNPHEPAFDLNERIIILDKSLKPELQQEVNALKVLQEVSENVKIVELQGEKAMYMDKQAGITVLPETPWSDALAAELNEQEKLFIEAWFVRQNFDQKERKGEGKDWDDPAFEPPDSTG